MDSMGFVRQFQEAMDRVKTTRDLHCALETICAALGFRYFALSHHVDFGARPHFGLRLHNYPNGYEAWFDSLGLGLVDPVHRASHMTHWRFIWSQVEELIPLTRLDERVFRHALSMGIGDGITVPYYVQGQMHGPLSFAKQVGEVIDPDTHYAVQMIGLQAFECVKRLTPAANRDVIGLTDRQRECVRWAMRGKTAWETSIIMGISRETVIDHLRDARARYGGPARSLLYFHVLKDGALCLDDILLEEPVWGKSPH